MNHDRKRILEMVESGQLTTKEALILLDALEKEDPAAPPSTKQEGEKSSKDSESQTTDEKEQQSSDSFYKQLENAGERLFDFVNQAVQKIKDMDLQFTQSVEVPHVFQQAADELDRIDIEIENGPIRLITWDQDDVRVECNAKVYRSDEREAGRNFFLEHTIFSLKDGLLLYGTQSKWMRVESTIYLPRKQYKNIKIRVFHGEVCGEELECNELLVKTTNGKIELAKVHGEKLDIETVNGQIKIAHSKAEKLEAETINGTVDTAGFYRTVELKSFNGNIHCALDQTGSRVIEAKAVTGNITLLLPKESSVDGEARSNLGSYKLKLSGIDVLHEKKEVIQKQVKFRRMSTDQQVIQMLADTKTGSVFVRETKQKGE